jgi:hypothetical protein
MVQDVSDGIVTRQSKLDFLLCGSPTDAFFSQMAFFRICLNAAGDAFRDARLVCVFENLDEAYLPPNWRGCFDAIEVEWVRTVAGENPGYRAQHNRRFEVVRDSADLAFMCDADVALVRPCHDLIHRLLVQPALAGVIAHYHFSAPHDELGDPDAIWPKLARDFLGKPIDRSYSYTLARTPAPNTAPFYINYGMLAGPPDLMRAAFERDRQLRGPVEEIVGEFFSAQVSLALACADVEIPTLALPMRYNFPNDRIADERYPGELENVVFLHYLRTRNFDRSRIVSNRDEFDRFLGLELAGSDAVFRDHVVAITHGRYPF